MSKTHEDPGGREYDKGLTRPGCSHEEIQARAHAKHLEALEADAKMAKRIAEEESVASEFHAERSVKRKDGK